MSLPSVSRPTTPPPPPGALLRVTRPPAVSCIKRTRYKFCRDVSWRSPYMNGVKSKDKAARDLELAVKEARQWIQVGRVGGVGIVHVITVPFCRK